MTVLNAILGTITFLLITVMFVLLTWLLFRLAIQDESKSKKHKKDTTI